MFTKNFTNEDLATYTALGCEKYTVSHLAESDCQALLPVEIWIGDLAVAIYAEETPVAYNDLEDLFLHHGMDIYNNDLLIKK